MRARAVIVWTGALVSAGALYFAWRERQRQRMTKPARLLSGKVYSVDRSYNDAGY